MMKNNLHNIAFIDAQNLYFGITKCVSCAKKLNIEIKDMKLDNCVCGKAWKLDLLRFRIFLKEKYHVHEAYYFLGNFQEKQEELYTEIQKSGFIVKFKEHTNHVKSTKKGNVDTDIVFEAMRNVLDNQDFNKIVFVSGDGDYKKVVQYLVSKNKFEKIFFPNSEFKSSLYNELGNTYTVALDRPDIRNILEFKK
jgi:uncharacterized LabA/DUF88 family protein